MTRTTKWDGESKHESHYFTHNHAFKQSPFTVKKNGAGKGNWGVLGSEVDDLIDKGDIPPVFNRNQRRGSNNSHNEENLFRIRNEQPIDSDIDED
ncbi:hypothetical protein PACTADRAFT_47900 [Pachysolen tannophilus NRRL Y-2460]|uniref:Hyaluronan/mRNA-binding protein domain-containing protein n=1 Tax=Pachysolen tannophilus NRRL Y-2460 TaxID=669874 RepID=A0A1E4U2D6_PACTA|nr:hypothetical protein PACTADRAFT_47900 [Pachysolen tannophilus NRRL Y-2460]